jgi:surface polysaccharide O-acyltransferase-like enzyme
MVTVNSACLERGSVGEGSLGDLSDGKKPGERLLSADIIRAVAIFIVIIIHVKSLFPYGPPNDLSSWWASNVSESLGLIGVPLFVLLSGMLLLGPSKLDEPLGVFFRKRLNRIVLPLVFWSAVYFAWREFAFHEVLTFDTVWHGFLGSYPYPYYQFWFFYMLIGLYLITPIIRVVVAHASSQLLGYFLLLWFIGTAVMPVLGQFASFYLGSGILIVTGWVGYFILGAYLNTMRVRRWFVYALAFLLGVLWTTVGTWFLTMSNGGSLEQFFYDYFSANVILTSVGLFLLLRNSPVPRLKANLPRLSSLLQQIGLCSFGIFLIHPMVIDVLGEKGLFGFNPGIIMLNPILGIPLLSFFTLAVSFAVIWLLRKVPMLNKAIG